MKNVIYGSHCYSTITIEYVIIVTLSVKNSCILGENMAGFTREGHVCKIEIM